MIFSIWVDYYLFPVLNFVGVNFSFICSVFLLWKCHNFNISVVCFDFNFLEAIFTTLKVNSSCPIIATDSYLYLFDSPWNGQDQTNIDEEYDSMAMLIYLDKQI